MKNSLAKVFEATKEAHTTLNRRSFSQQKLEEKKTSTPDSFEDVFEDIVGIINEEWMPEKTAGANMEKKIWFWELGGVETAPVLVGTDCPVAGLWAKPMRLS